MSSKGTALLFVIFVALCSLYWLMLRTEKASRIREFESKKVFSINAEDLRMISIQRTDEAATAATRPAADAPWAITQPHAIAAHQPAWSRIAEVIASLSNERSILGPPTSLPTSAAAGVDADRDASGPTAADLAQYQLDKPSVVVRAATADGAEVKVELGALDPTQTRVYARTESQGVFLAPKAALTDLDRPLLDLRNRFTVSLGDEGVTRMEYTRIRPREGAPEALPGATQPEMARGEESAIVALERVGENDWKLLEPVAGVANRDLANKLATQIQFLTGRDYVDAPESLDDYGLDPPLARVTVYSGDGAAPQTVYFGAFSKGDEQGGVYAKRADAPAVFVVDSDIVQRFPKTPDGFREKRLFARMDAEVLSLHYTAGATDITLENDPAKGWRVTKPSVEDSDQLVISNFIALLKVMTCSGFVSETKPEFGLDAPRIEIALTIKGRPEPARVSVGAQIPNLEMFYARQDTGAVVTLNRADVNALTRTLVDFRSKQILRFDKAAATFVNLRFEGADYELEKNAQTGTWSVKTPPGKIWESQSDMGALLDTLKSVPAVAVESDPAPADLTPFGLDTPLAVVSVTTRAADGAGTTALGPLSIGKPAPDNSQQRFAMVEGRLELFRTNQAVVDGLREALRGIRNQ